jgi:DEAD/DEAH box helicase domain-containing protein
MAALQPRAAKRSQPRPPWKPRIGIDAVIEEWVSSGYVAPCMAADRLLPSNPPSGRPIPGSLRPELAAALRGRGIVELWSHQAEAIEAAIAGQGAPPGTAGRHVVIATPTASGKSLCFHLPVLQALAEDPTASAIYLYPTKALARDQESGLRELVAEAALEVAAIVYDGDTPGDARRAAREKSPIVLTNPDMLHAGILPHHAHWARTFRSLRYVVIDELHTYRGVFGSHVAHVIERLKRVAAFHGSSPTFLCATATIGNAREHAARLLGVDESEVTLCDQSGAPRGERRFFLYNPPVVNAELGVRASYVKASVRLAADLVRARVPTIVFGASRNTVETMLKYLRDAVGVTTGDGRAGQGIPADAIMAYRGGYLPETRRKIERGLRAGEILCVVATNALELGIDIGDLDAVICAGYPGSIAGTWQRFGRAGRRGASSIAVLVASSAGIDQYLAQNPEHLLDGAVEQARIDPHNTEILVQHLKCAAFELPFLDGEPYAGTAAADTGEALRYLADHGVLHQSSGRFHWAADAYPANHVSLRSIGWDNFVIIDKVAGKTLAELDWRAAHTMLHEQAIYQHDAEQYQVEELDYDNHKAFVRRVEPDYFTTAMVNRKVSILEESAAAPLGHALGTWGEVSVVEKVVGYKKIKFYTHENAGYGEVRLPDMQMHTTSFWLTVPEAICLELGMPRAAAIDGLRGVAVALETVATLLLMCDPRDIGQTLEPGIGGGASGAGLGAPRRGQAGDDPTLFLFDNVPGGVGLAERIWHAAPELLANARQLLLGCACKEGCPLCVGASPIAEALGASRKRAATRLVELVLHAS